MEMRKTVINKLKIALFTNSMECGGAERVILSLAQDFVNKGFKVDLVLSKAVGQYLEFLPPEVRLIDLSASKKFTRFLSLIQYLPIKAMKAHDVNSLFKALPALIHYLRKEKPRVLLSALEHANFLALLAKKVSLSSTRVYISEHNTLRHTAQRKTSRDKIGLCLIKFFYPWAEAVIAVSRGVAEDLANIVKLPHEKIRVIYNPVVTPEIFSKAKEPLEHPWFVPDQPPVILAVGRLTEVKDYYTLIRAFALVRAERSVRLVILGEGEDRSKLEALVQELGLRDYVSLPGFVDNPYAYMARASILVLSSIREGFGNVLVEAMAVGTPVVSTDCHSGPAEILEGGKWGRLVPVGNPEILAEAIIATIINKPDSAELIDRAKYFGLEKISGEYLEILSPER